MPISRPLPRSRAVPRALPALLLSCSCAVVPYEAAAEAHDGRSFLGAGLVQGPVDVASEEGSGSEAAASLVARQIVYTGTVRLSVAATEAAAEAAGRIATELGGWVQDLTSRGTILRIPADRWQEALSRVSALGRVLDRRIQASDVTEQVVDLRIRLKNAVALRDRLAQLLEKADTVAAALQIETELTRVRTEIEQLEGRLQVLERQVAFATLTVDLVQAAAAPPAVSLPFHWLSELGLPSLLGGRR